VTKRCYFDPVRDGSEKYCGAVSGVWYDPGVRRVLGILLNAATVVSLLLCVATIVLWVRSYSGRNEMKQAGGGNVDAGFREGKGLF
jgi:hypothetical protein